MIFIDSDCIIDFLKGDMGAVSVVGKYKDEIVSSQINVFEIFHGIYRKREVSDNEVRSADGFFGSISVLPFDSMCGKMSSRIFTDLVKRGKMIDQNDCFIAGIMAKHGCKKIITRNEKHFSKVKGIKVVSY